MELVYLWVEKYKNIEKQGFNFSPRFECEFKDEYDSDGKLKDNCELVIKPKEHLKNFFGDNITITAIVGENGSGKSSLLTGITNAKTVIKIGDQLFSKSFKNIKSNIKIITSYIEEDHYDYIYLDFDLIKINPINDFSDYFNLNIYDKNLYTLVANDIAGDYNFNIGNFRERFFNMLLEHIQTFQSKLFFFNPIEIILSDYLHNIKVQDNIFEYINKLIKEVQNSNYTKEKFLVFLYSDTSRKVPLKMTKIDTSEDIVSIEKEILEKSDYYKIENIEEIYDFFNSLNEFENKKKISIEKFSIVYEKHKKAFLKLIEIGYLRTNFMDSIDREYFDLSQGERKFFTESLMIYDAIKKNKNKNIFLVLDEPDLTLHPEWQKKYLSELLKLLHNFPNKKFHIIITSHSPFILSDLPKENVVFLKDGKQVEVNINPFGANIHTLLSHGFFMEGGLMGEFAKSKINDVIKILKEDIVSKENLDYCKNTISIIGEPILKKTLEHKLNEKLFPKETKLEKLQRKQKEIEDEIKEELESSKKETK